MYSNTAWTVRDNLGRSVATDWVIFVRPHDCTLRYYLNDIKAVQLSSTFTSQAVPRTSCGLRIRIDIVTLCAVSYGPSSWEGHGEGSG